MGDRHPHDDPIALELLRPALERAFVTVRAGQRATPPTDPPPSLRPFLRFTRLRGRALAAVRAAVDGDDELRGRVAEVADDGELGAAGELWIERPDGWEDALADLIDERRSVDDRRRSEAAEQDLARQLGVLERERDRLAAELTAVSDQAGAAREELAAERRRRQEAEQHADEVAERIDSLTRRTTTAEERARSAEASLGEERGRVRELRDRVAELEAAPEPRAAVAAASAAVPEAAAPVPNDGGSPPLPMHEIAAMLGDASSGAEQLARGLASLVELFAPPSEPTADGVAKGPRRPRARRRPLVLPGLMEEDDEATAWLLRAPGALVLVDGYNVTLSGWPGTELSHQRDRLVDLLGAEAVRTNADVRIVFDGADVDRAAAGRVRCPVAVEFTDADVEADDRILELVAHEPVDRAVIVVSSDHRVRDGARAGGANVLSSEQLLRHLTSGRS